MLDVHVAAGIAKVTLNGRRGSLQREVSDLARALGRASDVRSVVFSGWSTPTDPLPTPAPVPPSVYERQEDARAMMRDWFDLDKPVIAAVDADSSVPTLILMADIVVAEAHVRFSDMHTPNGIVSATQPFLWPLSSGLAKAKRYILTGDPITADEAERIGLIAEVVPTGQSLNRAMQYAERLAAMRPAAVELTKRSLNQWQRAMFAPVFEPTLALELMTLPVEKGGNPQHDDR
jgi:enoyl-CoA hydratase